MPTIGYRPTHDEPGHHPTKPSTNTSCWPDSTAFEQWCSSPDPGDGIVGRMPAQDGQTGQGRSGSPVPSETTQLNPFSTPGAFSQRSQGGHHWSRITGHAEIGPVEVMVGPRRIPVRVEIQPEVGNLVAGIGIPGVKRNGGDLGPIGQHHDGSVQVQIKSLMIVAWGSALWRIIAHVPVDLALRTHDYGSDVSHALILASADALGPARATEVPPMPGTNDQLTKRNHGQMTVDLFCFRAANTSAGSCTGSTAPSARPRRSTLRRAAQSGAPRGSGGALQIPLSPSVHCHLWSNTRSPHLRAKNRTRTGSTPIHEPHGH